VKILQVSTADIAGGAERVAWHLFQEYRRSGHDSWLAVGRKRTTEPGVLIVPRETTPGIGARLCKAVAASLELLGARSASARRVQRAVAKLPDLPRWIRWQLGVEEFDFPGSRQLLSLPPHRPDVVHCHNLHGQILPRGGYFDLRELPWLSRQLPVVLTLHDTWMLSGHCAYTLGCDRWITGCGKCPALTIYPSIRRDATAYNWQRKRSIYQNSRLYVATPSQWLMKQVEQSILAPAVIEARVIPNGVDLSIFHPSDKASARAALGIPDATSVLLFVANGIRHNAFKDYQTVRISVARAADVLPHRNLLLIALGDEASTERIGTMEVRFIPYQKDQRTVAHYYQAADVYLHAARADTFPNVILEALACGTPVVATGVGGIPEQIEDGRTGFLVPAGDANGLAQRIVQILSDDNLQARLSVNAAQDARHRFDLRQQVASYLGWYEYLVYKSSPVSIHARG
jgi:glycosyltransferase involved in cell wall biosynthesis